MNSQENWDLEVATNVFKAIKKFPRKDVRAILEVIKSLPVNPYTGDIRKLGGEEHAWRRRVGAYRISYELYPTRKFILVFEVKRRTSHTY
jgi:mRNA-degrading endonuclease RelE of RelBE toxin-antitoxin system